MRLQHRRKRRPPPPRPPPRRTRLTGLINACAKRQTARPHTEEAKRWELTRGDSDQRALPSSSRTQQEKHKPHKAAQLWCVEQRYSRSVPVPPSQNQHVFCCSDLFVVWWFWHWSVRCCSTNKNVEPTARSPELKVGTVRFCKPFCIFHTYVIRNISHIHVSGTWADFLIGGGGDLCTETTSNNQQTGSLLLIYGTKNGYLEQNIGGVSRCVRGDWSGYFDRHPGWASCRISGAYIGYFGRGEIPVCGENIRYFKSKHDLFLFLTLTTCFFCAWT